jgi:hypothetical protein
LGALGRVKQQQSAQALVARLAQALVQLSATKVATQERALLSEQQRVPQQAL